MSTRREGEPWLLDLNLLQAIKWGSTIIDPSEVVYVLRELPQTDDGAGAPPATPRATSPAQAGESDRNTGPVVAPIRQPRVFELYRHRDVTGKSGTGVVAWGTLWPDDTVSLRWAGATPSFSNWDSLDVLVDVHGHEGATVPRWLNRVCRDCGCTDEAACFGGCWWVEPDLCSQCSQAGGE